VGEPAGHAFISYVREDSHNVDKLQRALEAAGVSVWRDTADLWPGEDWRAKIRRAITDDALVFIACFSTRSAARVKSYQNEELVLAIEQLRLRRPDIPWLIPVRFDDCDVPDFDLGGGRTLASIQRADFFADSRDVGIARLVAAVLRLPGRRSPDGGMTNEEWDAFAEASRAARAAEIEARRAWREAEAKKKFRFSVTSQGPEESQYGRAEASAETRANDFSKKNPLVVRGQHSKVLELDLPRGGYRLSWSAEGEDYFRVDHESGRDGTGIMLASAVVPNPSHGETIVRIGESGRHIFSVEAAKLTWELRFTLL
jgi:TIR domain